MCITSIWGSKHWQNRDTGAVCLHSRTAYIKIKTTENASTGESIVSIQRGVTATDDICSRLDLPLIAEFFIESSFDLIGLLQCYLIVGWEGDRRKYQVSTNMFSDIYLDSNKTILISVDIFPVVYIYAVRRCKHPAPVSRFCQWRKQSMNISREVSVMMNDKVPVTESYLKAFSHLTV